MNKEIADKWVAELRSGKHRQTRRTMKDCDGAMCCLGVLQEVVMGEPIHRAQCYLTRSVASAAGMKSTTGDRSPSSTWVIGNKDFPYPLAYQNDEARKSFAEIADIIEAEWENL